MKPAPVVPPRARRHALRHPLLACALLLAIAGVARADAVTDWNAIVSSPPVQPILGAAPQQLRAQAMVHIAIHDALNSIERRYETYAAVPPANPSASADAAVATAAYRVLLHFMPSSTPVLGDGTTLQAYYDSRIAGLPDPARSAGVAAGEAAAAAILALRNNDGSATPHLPYTLAPAPGVYQPTPNPEFPAQVTPSFAGWANVIPFALRSAAQFRVEPGEIFDLTSEAYAREYNEVKEIGDARVRGAAPNSEGSDIARFWPGGGSDWNATARMVVAGLGLDMWQHARLFALLNMARSDAWVASMDSKYSYNFWRPVTAIRWGDDGNPATASDPGWRPFLVTPPYPDYPCNLPTNTGAAAEVLRRYFGTDDIAFTRTLTAGAVPLPAPMTPLPAKSITRHFESLSEAEDESARARVYAGIHFSSGCKAGVRLGNKIGRFAYQHYLRPVK